MHKTFFLKVRMSQKGTTDHTHYTHIHRVKTMVKNRTCSRLQPRGCVSVYICIYNAYIGVLHVLRGYNYTTTTRASQCIHAHTRAIATIANVRYIYFVVAANRIIG